MIGVEKVQGVHPAAIILARESRGWSQKNLARAIGVHDRKISKFELGVLRVGETDFSAIARSLQYDESFFAQADRIYGLGGDFLYRKRASLSAAVKRRVEAEANIRRIQVAQLLRSARMTNEAELPAIQPEEFDDHIEKIVAEFRRALRIPDGPIRNLTRIIENAGAIVFTIDFESDLIDGTNLRLAGFPAMLFVNKTVSGERNRFNLAHELGHAVMHFSTAAIGDAEDQANAFANELLMPKHLIRSDLRNLDLEAATRLKAVWGVSMAALIKRARTLGLITEYRYQQMFIMLSGKGLRRVEPMPIEFEKPEAFDNLVKWHREQLGLDDEEMRKVLFTDKLGPVPVTETHVLRLTPEPDLWRST